MRCLRFALPGMVLLFFLLCSCSFGTEGLEEVVVSKEETAPIEEEGADPTERETEDPEEDPEDEEEDPEEGEEDEEELPPAAVFLGLKAVLGDAVVFEFSQPVTVAELDFGPDLEVGGVLEEDHTVTVLFEEDLEPGKWYNAALLVEDEYENSLDVQTPFRFRNSRIPEMLITELRTANTNSSFKGEFIEFKMLSDGNLGELRVFAVWNEGNSKVGKNPVVYEFEPVEVKSGEYVTLHFRTFQEACKDEYGEDLAESGGTDSSPTARDFWIPGKDEKLLHNTDIVYVLDQDDLVLDAVMLAEKPEAWKNKSYFPKAAEFLFSKGAWSSTAGTIPGIEDAVSSSGTTTTRTICRDETVGNTRTAADWYVTVTSGATPGKPNNKERFVN